MMLTTNGIAIQVAKTEKTSPTYFRAAMAEKWQGMTAKTGGNLWGNTFIPFGFKMGMGMLRRQQYSNSQTNTSMRLHSASFKISQT
jgi:hypothetical protein